MDCFESSKTLQTFHGINSKDINPNNYLCSLRISSGGSIGNANTIEDNELESAYKRQRSGIIQAEVMKEKVFILEIKNNSNVCSIDCNGWNCVRNVHFSYSIWQLNFNSKFEKEKTQTWKNYGILNPKDMRLQTTPEICTYISSQQMLHPSRAYYIMQFEEKCEILLKQLQSTNPVNHFELALDLHCFSNDEKPHMSF